MRTSDVCFWGRGKLKNKRTGEVVFGEVPCQEPVMGLVDDGRRPMLGACMTHLALLVGNGIAEVTDR